MRGKSSLILACIAAEIPLKRLLHAKRAFHGRNRLEGTWIDGLLAKIGFKVHIFTRKMYLKADSCHFC